MSNKRLLLRYALAVDVLVVALVAIFFLLPAGSAVAPFYFLLAGAAVVGFLGGSTPALAYSAVALVAGGLWILPAAGSTPDGRQLIFFGVQAAAISLLAGTFGLQRPARKVRQTPQSVGGTLFPREIPAIEEAPVLPIPEELRTAPSSDATSPKSFTDLSIAPLVAASSSVAAPVETLSKPSANLPFRESSSSGESAPAIEVPRFLPAEIQPSTSAVPEPLTPYVPSPLPARQDVGVSERPGDIPVIMPPWTRPSRPPSPAPEPARAESIHEVDATEAGEKPASALPTVPVPQPFQLRSQTSRPPSQRKLRPPTPPDEFIPPRDVTLPFIFPNQLTGASSAAPPDEATESSPDSLPETGATITSTGVPRPEIRREETAPADAPSAEEKALPALEETKAVDGAAILSESSVLHRMIDDDTWSRLPGAHERQSDSSVPSLFAEQGMAKADLPIQRPAESSPVAPMGPAGLTPYDELPRFELEEESNTAEPGQTTLLSSPAVTSTGDPTSPSLEGVDGNLRELVTTDPTLEEEVRQVIITEIGGEDSHRSFSVSEELGLTSRGLPAELPESSRPSETSRLTGLLRQLDEDSTTPSDSVELDAAVVNPESATPPEFSTPDESLLPKTTEGDPGDSSLTRPHHEGAPGPAPSSLVSEPSPPGQTELFPLSTPRGDADPAAAPEDLTAPDTTPAGMKFQIIASPPVPPDSARQSYEVRCHECVRAFDAIAAEWCSCLTKDRSLVCPNCLNCFCQASPAYRAEFWEGAPTLLHDRRTVSYRHDVSGVKVTVPASLPRPLVMLVEDDDNVRSIVERIIKKLGFGLVIAGDGIQGLEFGRLYEPDLVLSEALLPGFDGREMCRLLRAEPGTANSKLIIMTGLYTEPRYRWEALRHFLVDDYIFKPVPVGDLIHLLERHLLGHERSEPGESAATNPAARAVNTGLEAPPETYDVSCFSCTNQFDALVADFCECLVKERSVVCPQCRNCFCKASVQYKQNFWVHAPAALYERQMQGNSKSLGLPDPPPEEVSHPLLLLVGDDDGFQALVRQLVAEGGYGLIVASDGDEGLAAARRYVPELVLSDALLPRLDGREMCRLIKSEGLPCSTAIMTWLYTDAKYTYGALRDFELDEYIAKPVSREELLRLIERYLGEGTSRD